MNVRAELQAIFGLIEAGRIGDAEARCRDSLEAATDDVNLLGLLGAILLKQGRLDEAERYLSRTVEIEPAFAKPWEDLGALWVARGDRDRAAVFFARAAELRPPQRPRDPRLAEAERLRADGKSAQAAAICQAILEKEPDQPGALRLLAVLATDNDQFVVAEGYLRRIVARAPDDPRAVIDLCRFLGDRGRYREAIGIIDGAGDDARRHPDLQRLLGDTCSILGNSKAALAAYERCLSARPNDLEALTGRGHMLRIVGRREEAKQCYRRAVELRPDAGDAWWHLASLHDGALSDQDRDSMQSLLQAPALTDASRASLLFALARCDEAREDFAAAWEAYSDGNALKRSLVKYDPVETELTMQKIASVFDAGLFEAISAAMPRDRTPVFIVGMPRSGSTLVEQILASHSQVQGGGELPYVIMLANALRGGDGTLRYPEIVRDFDSAAFEGLGRTYLYHAAGHLAEDRPYFTDKMPANFQHAGLIRLMLPHAKIIDARRAPLAACVANFRQLYAQGKNQSYDLVELGEYYLAYRQMMDHWDEVMPGRILRVDYEDVVADLEGQVRRMLEFCELPFEPACVEFHRNERPVNTASSEQVRQPIYTSAVNYWRNYEPWLGELREILAPVL